MRALGCPSAGRGGVADRIRRCTCGQGGRGGGGWGADGSGAPRVKVYSTRSCIQAFVRRLLREPALLLAIYLPKRRCWIVLVVTSGLIPCPLGAGVYLSTIPSSLGAGGIPSAFRRESCELRVIHGGNDDTAHLVLGSWKAGLDACPTMDSDSLQVSQGLAQLLPPDSREEYLASIKGSVLETPAVDGFGEGDTSLVSSERSFGMKSRGSKSFLALKLLWTYLSLTTGLPKAMATTRFVVVLIGRAPTHK